MTNQTSRKWSPQQKAIFSWFEKGSGNLVVRARAGTGKTSTILQGVEYAPEASILLAAFNKSIATELQTRIKNEHVQAKTLHGLGFGYIRRAWSAVTVDTDGKRAVQLAQSVCEPDSPYQAVQLVAKIHTMLRETSPFATTADDALEIMSRFDLMPDDTLEVEDGITPLWIANRASRAVEAAKVRTPLIDFADMIFLPLVNKMITPWFNLVVIDEAQDMSSAQLALAVGACKKNGRICVVGDDRQAIYQFRGVDSDSIDNLKKKLNAKELGLTTTYRCPKRVVEIASKLVPDFHAAPEAPEGIIESINAISMMAVAGPRDFILSRSNAPLIKVCLGLLRAGKKASIKGRDIGKGILALINRQKASNIDDLLTRLSTWHDRESKRAIKNLTEKAAENRLEFLDDQLAVIQTLAEDLNSLDDLRVKLTTLFTDNDGSAIMCSTTHRAKGLESENVFLLTGTFQSRKSTNTTEEDNILYVAVTRSKQRLVWVSGFERNSKEERL